MIDVAIQLTMKRRGGASFQLNTAFCSEARRIALFGASGSGKSLTMQVIAGLLRPQRGHISIDGRTFFDSDTKVFIEPGQRHIGYVPQEYALFPHMNAQIGRAHV